MWKFDTHIIDINTLHHCYGQLAGGMSRDRYMKQAGAHTNTCLHAFVKPGPNSNVTCVESVPNYKLLPARVFRRVQKCLRLHACIHEDMGMAYVFRLHAYIHHVTVLSTCHDGCPSEPCLRRCVCPFTHALTGLGL
jgi:hypothetical protein